MRLQVFRTLKWIYIISFACVLSASGCNSSGTHTDYLYLKPETTVFDTTGRQVMEMETVDYASHIVTTMIPVSEYTYGATQDFLLINKAYASHKERNTVKNFETVTDITIITLNNYNALFPAGSNVADSCIFFLHTAGNDSSVYVPIVKDSSNKKDIIGWLNTDAGKGKRYEYYDMPNLLKRFSFKVKYPPVYTGIQQFAIQIETGTPSKFGDTTIRFTLKP